MSPDDQPNVAPAAAWTNTDVAEADLPEPDLDDPDNPEWTEEDFARAVGPEAMSFLELTAFPNTLDRLMQTLEPPRGWTLLKLDPEVIARFKAGGPDWRERMGAALKAAADGAGG